MNRYVAFRCVWIGLRNLWKTAFRMKNNEWIGTIWNCWFWWISAKSFLEVDNQLKNWMVLRSRIFCNFIFAMFLLCICQWIYCFFGYGYFKIFDFEGLRAFWMKNVEWSGWFLTCENWWCFCHHEFIKTERCFSFSSGTCAFKLRLYQHLEMHWNLRFELAFLLVLAWSSIFAQVSN